MCQSAGCAAIASANASAIACVIVATSVCGTGAAVRASHEPVTASPAYQSVVGIRAAPVRSASNAGPAGIVALGTEERHRHAARGEIAVGEQAQHAARAQPLLEHLERRALLPDAASTSNPRLSRKATNCSIQLGRLQALGDGGERHAGQHQPGAGVIPVAHVGQRQDRAFTGGVRLAKVVLLAHVHPADDALGLQGPAAGSSRASSGRTSAVPGGSSRVEVGALRDHARQVGARGAAVPLPCRRQARSAPSWKRRAATRSGRPRTTAQPARYARARSRFIAG